MNFRQPRDLAGRRFGRLIAIEPVWQSVPSDPARRAWRCVCDCGKEKIASTGNLVSGCTQSCGCVRSSIQRDVDARNEARAAGLATYVPSAPCRHGHRLRSVKSGLCIQCGRDKVARYSHRRGPRPKPKLDPGTFETCWISGCSRPAKSDGLCLPHLDRLKKYGDPEGGRAPPGVPHEFYRSVVLTCAGEECLDWPFARGRKGYARLRVAGKTRIVSRMACEAVNGPPPSPIHEAAHSCGRGHFGCVNPRHLSWKTPAENSADKIAMGTWAHGESSPVSRLTEQAVRQIIEMKGRARAADLAERFGVTRGTINAIQSGKSWAWLNQPANEGISE